MSIVKDLHRLALESDADINALLLKVYLVGRNRKIPSIVEWATAELEGYEGANIEVPAYRKIHCELVVEFPNGSLVPVRFTDPVADGKSYSILRCEIPISEIQALVLANRGGMICCSLPPDIEMHLHSVLVDDYGQKVQFPTRLRFPTTRFESLIGRLKRQALEVLMQIEEDGILGEEVLTPSPKENEKTPIMNFNINAPVTNLQGIANSSNQTVNHATNQIDTTLQEILRAIKSAQSVTTEQIEKAEDQIAVIEAQASLPVLQRKPGLLDRAQKILNGIGMALPLAEKAKDLFPELQKLLS